VNCERCQIPLQPGAAHISESACIEGLRHALSEALKCAGCGKPASECEGQRLACAPCGSAAYARKKAGQGLGWLGMRILERFNEPTPPATDGGGGGSGGKKWGG
jgi:hypothetical protein